MIKHGGNLALRLLNFFHPQLNWECFLLPKKLNFILLMNIRRFNFMLSWVEHEKISRIIYSFWTQSSHLIDQCYIDITFPGWVIVEKIIQRNVIISLGAAKVDNHIFRDDVFDYHPIRECNIYFIIPSIRCFIFYRLMPTMKRGVPKGK